MTVGQKASAVSSKKPANKPKRRPSATASAPPKPLRPDIDFIVTQNEDYIDTADDYLSQAPAPQRMTSTPAQKPASAQKKQPRNASNFAKPRKSSEKPGRTTPMKRQVRASPMPKAMTSHAKLGLGSPVPDDCEEVITVISGEVAKQQKVGARATPVRKAPVRSRQTARRSRPFTSARLTHYTDMKFAPDSLPVKPARRKFGPRTAAIVRRASTALGEQVLFGGKFRSLESSLRDVSALVLLKRLNVPSNRLHKVRYRLKPKAPAAKASKLTAGARRRSQSEHAPVTPQRKKRRQTQSYRQMLIGADEQNELEASFGSLERSRSGRRVKRRRIWSPSASPTRDDLATVTSSPGRADSPASLFEPDDADMHESEDDEIDVGVDDFDVFVNHHAMATRKKTSPLKPPARWESDDDVHEVMFDDDDDFHEAVITTHALQPRPKKLPVARREKRRPARRPRNMSNFLLNMKLSGKEKEEVQQQQDNFKASTSFKVKNPLRNPLLLISQRKTVTVRCIARPQALILTHAQRIAKMIRQRSSATTVTSQAAASASATNEFRLKRLREIRRKKSAPAPTARSKPDKSKLQVQVQAITGARKRRSAVPAGQ